MPFVLFLFFNLSFILKAALRLPARFDAAALFPNGGIWKRSTDAVWRKRSRRRQGVGEQCTSRNNGLTVGNCIFSLEEGSWRSVDISWSWTGALLLCLQVRATNPLLLLAAVRHFLLSNEWSCFLSCWNTPLLRKPRKYPVLVPWTRFQSRSAWICAVWTRERSAWSQSVIS